MWSKLVEVSRSCTPGNLPGVSAVYVRVRRSLEAQYLLRIPAADCQSYRKSARTSKFCRTGEGQIHTSLSAVGTHGKWLRVSSVRHTDCMEPVGHVRNSSPCMETRGSLPYSRTNGLHSRQFTCAAPPYEC